MDVKNNQQIDHLLSRPDKLEMIAPLSRLAVVDNCFGIGGAWFASGREFHASEGFPHKAEIALFDESGKEIRETEHTRGWFPSVCWHKRVFNKGQIVVRELKFIGKDCVFDVLELINHTAGDLDLTLALRGRASAEGTVYFKDGRIHVDEENGRTLSGTHMVVVSEPQLQECHLSLKDVDLVPDFSPGPRELSGEHVRYLAGASVKIPADGRTKAVIAVSWALSKKQALSQIPKNLLTVDSLLPELKQGWKSFWKNSVPELSVPDEGLKKLYYYGCYVMWAQTMPPQGRLSHIYVAPTKFAHVGVWLQDHAYIATGAKWLNSVGLSQNSIRLLQKNQFSNGMIPSSINAYGVRFYDKESGIGTTLDVSKMGKHTAAEIPTQFPPSFTIAANEVFNKTWNMDFLRECYRAALKLDDWMVSEREDENGLFKAFHLMDIEHLAGGLRMGDHEYIKAVDISALNVYHRRLLQKWGTLLGDKTKIEVLQQRADKTEKSVLDLAWDPDRKFFYDILPDGSRSPVETAAGFYTLYLDELRDTLPALLDVLRDRTRFWSPLPVPTVSLKSEDSGQGVSQSVDWFLINGLARWGLRDPAEQIARKLLNAHIRDGLPESREGFGPRSGSGMGASDFAWIGLSIDLLLGHILGVQPSYGELLLEPWFPGPWERASIKGLSIGPYMVNLSFRKTESAITISICPHSQGISLGPLPVNLVWRVQPGRVLESMSPAGTVAERNGSQEVRISLKCPLNTETRVSIRSRKA